MALGAAVGAAGLAAKGPGGISAGDWALVKQIAGRYGVDPYLLVAIGFHETGWGKLGDGRYGNVLGYGSYDSGSTYKYAGLSNQLAGAASLLSGWGVHTVSDFAAGKARRYATDPGWTSHVLGWYSKLKGGGTYYSGGSIGTGSSGGGGGSVSLGAGGNSLLNATTSMRAPTPDELAREFGYSTAFFNTDPSLKAVINEAMREGIDPSSQEGQLRFQAMIRNTTWYKKHSEAQRQWAALVQGDPTTANNNVNNMVKDVLFQAVQMGATMDLKTARGIAVDFLSNGLQNDQTLLKAAIGSHVVFVKNHPFKGQAGQYEEEYRKLTQDYGIPTTQEQIGFYVVNTSNQRGTEEAVRRHVQEQAKQLYPGLQAAIDSGLTVRQAMDPYFAEMANTLEISPDQVTVKDPLIQRALQYRAPGADTSKPTTIMPIWEFQQQLKNDPRWMKTTNARDDMVGAGIQVLRDMGLAVPSASYGQSSGGG